MIDKIKALGLALVAIFALGAVAAQVASAAEETKPGLFTASVGATETAKVDAEQTAEGKDKFKLANGLSFTCKKVTATGEPIKTKASPEEDVANGSQPGPESTDITLTPTFETCHVVIAGITRPITFTTNGCAYILDARTTVTESGFDHTALTTIECPTGKKIEVHVYEKAPHSTVICTYDINPQNTLPGTTLEDKLNTPGAANDVLAKPNVKEIPVENTILSSICGPTTATTATYEGEDTIRATNEAGEFVDDSVSPEETKPALFTFGGLSKDTETARVDVEQTAEGKDKFKLANNLSFTCKKIIATGEPIKTKASPEEDVANGATAGTESTDLTLTPSVEACHVIIAGITRPVTVTMNGCAFIPDAKTTVIGVSFNYTALDSLECPTGKKIEIHVYEKEPHEKVICTYDIKPQSTLRGTTLEDKLNTPGAANDVLAKPNVKEIAVENTILSSICGPTTATTATYEGEDTIRATNEAGEFVDVSVSD